MCTDFNFSVQCSPLSEQIIPLSTRSQLDSPTQVNAGAKKTLSCVRACVRACMDESEVISPRMNLWIQTAECVCITVRRGGRWKLRFLFAAVVRNVACHTYLTINSKKEINK